MHLARLLFLAVAYLVGYGFVFMTALLLLVQAVYIIIGKRRGSRFLRLSQGRK